jgi:hypothetical protein
MKLNWKKLGIFAGGVVFGTAGIAILKSEDAKRVYEAKQQSTTSIGAAAPHGCG